MLRSTGFPVSGLTRLSTIDWRSRRCGRDDSVAKADLRPAYQWTMDSSRWVSATSLRTTGFTWEQAGGLDVLDAFSGARELVWTPSGRKLGRQILGQWQRYCAINDTIGLFGPLAWVALDSERATTTATVGPQVLAQVRGAQPRHHGLGTCRR
jgi:hypothetical protein